MKYLRLNRNFQLILLGYFFSQFGAWVNYLAILNIALYEFHASPLTLVMVSAASLLPPVAAGKVIARIASKYRADQVLPASLLCLICTTLSLLFCKSLFEFLGILCVKSLAMGLSDPAINAFVSDSVPELELRRAFSLLNLSRNISKIAAPSVGAVASIWVGDRHVVLISAILLFFAIPCFFFSQKKGSEYHAPIEIKEKGSESQKISISQITPLLIYTAVYALLVFSVNNQFPLILKNESFDKSVLGVLVSSSAFGGVVGNLQILNRRRTSDVENTTLSGMLWAGLVSSVLFIYIGVVFLFRPSMSELVLAIGFWGTGFSASRFAVARNFYISSRFSTQVANVTARVQSVQLTCQFVAPLMGAILVEKFTPPALFFVIGICAAAAYSSVAIRMRVAKSEAGGMNGIQ
ncbi:MFS transporter [Burkholderia gladioli]|uniref:MFS transporter n=1 Tax=Burkholderia gladioli TaxID=28095 RepID=UPI001FC81114|nr:MFS transporter [Burkholderia gladioli]MDC6129629.1 MFS transporter [Burkholderia gladioli]